MDKTFLEGLLDEVGDGIYFLDVERRITYWSRGAERLTGYRAEEVLGRRCSDNLLVHSDETGRALCASRTCPAALAMREDKEREAEIFLKHKAGHRVPVTTRVRPIRDAHGRVTGAAEIFRVAADSAASEARMRELEHLALVDPLTGVGNRRLGEKELRAGLNEARRYGWRFAVVFLDIDSFKALNDAHGHEAGDRLLRMVAQTLAHNVRSFDTVIRWGGEEFLVVLKNVTEQQTLATARKLCGLIGSGSLTHGAFHLRVTVSVGATPARAGDSAESLVRRADGLMYDSKQAGGNRVSVSAAADATAESCKAAPRNRQPA